MPKSQVQIRYKRQTPKQIEFHFTTTDLNHGFSGFFFVYFIHLYIYFFLVGHIWCCICYDDFIFKRIWRRNGHDNPEIISFRKVNIRL